MSTQIQVGKEIKYVDVFDMLPPLEGSIDIYYGRIGNGKTSTGTRNILKELKQGLVVYSNWKVNWEGYDERKLLRFKILGALGLKRKFMVIPKSNFHFWNFVKQEIDGLPCFPFVEQISKLTDCRVHLDEGHIPFDSYEATRMDEKKRSAVFATRHFDRGLIIYTQRANSVHVNLRGNANRFFKCEKIRDFTLFRKRFIRIQVTEFQDLTGSNTVDESRHRDPETGEENGEYKYMVRQERYWIRKKLFNAFDSKYLRGDLKHSQENFAKFYKLTWTERLKLITQKNEKNT